MSYIRCSSNPEALYIWDDGKNANIVCDMNNQTIQIIPSKIFSGLIKKYKKNYGEDTTYKGASIKEVFVKSGKKPNKFQKLLRIEDGNFQYRLSYKNWYIDMWQVTWEHIAQ